MPVRFLLLSAALTGVASAGAATITLANADFQADLNQANTVITGWTSADGTGTNNPPSNYFANDIPDLAGNRVALVKSDGGNYLQQVLTTSDQGAVDATTFDTYTLSFNYGYRRDAVRNGDSVFRISLWNTTDNVEITGTNLTVVDPLTTGTNTLIAGQATLSYDRTLVSPGDGIAIRLTSTSADLGVSAWQRTVIFDAFSLTAVASAVPEPTTYGVAAAGVLAVASFVRRRRRA